MHFFTLTPRISEINVGGHVGNAVLPIWMEEARLPILNEALKWMASTDTHMVRHAAYDYERELLHRGEVEIRSVVKNVGTTSLTLYQEVWQNGQRGAAATTTIVFFNRAEKSKAALSTAARTYLEELIE